MALLGISPPPAFLQSPGEPTVPFEAWIRMFDNYVLALADNIEDKRKRALLIHTVGAEAQRIFYTLPGIGDSYDDALKALKTFFVPKLNVVAERNKFRQRAQRAGETTAQYAAALRELIVTCEFGALSDDMIRDQIVEKTSNARIRERLLLEDKLTLAKTLTIAAQIENAVAEAKTIASSGGAAEAVVGMVRGNTFRGGKQRHQKHSSTGPRPPPKPAALNGSTAAGKTCYRCGSSAHVANYSKCPAKSVTCRQCNKPGHYARVCKSRTSSSTVGEVSSDCVTVLLVDEGEAVKQRSKLMCSVSMKALGGPTITVDLMVDTGSHVSILPEHMYKSHFSHTPLLKPRKTLITYTRKPIPVLGCVKLAVTYMTHCTTQYIHIVSAGTPVLGMDLFNALQLEIREGHVTTNRFPTVPVQHIATETDTGTVTGFVHKVAVRPEIQPVQHKLRRLPFAIRDAVSEELQRLEKDGVIERIDSSPWVSPIVVVHRKSGRLRICPDLREPNKAVIVDSHPLPHIEEVFHELRGAQIFSSIDLQNAYHQVPLHPESRDLTGFITHDGLFRFTKVPFGLASAPSAFQRMMSQILSGLDGVQCYLDDIIVYADTPTLHDARLKAVLHRLNKSGLKLNMEKCLFRKNELSFLGHVVSASGIRPNPDHVTAVTEAPPPRDAKALQSFLGLTGWYSKFIPCYASVVEPLRALLRKNADFTWTDAAQVAFTRIKDLIATSPALTLFDPALPTLVTTDACDYGIGAVLTQMHGHTERTVAFASRSLTDCERKYSIIEKEALACVWAAERWRTYLWGRHFTLRTDHSPLTALLSTKGFGRAGMRISRWSARLMCFNYTVEYKPGHDNVIADCLSRMPLLSPDPQALDEDIIAMVSTDSAAVTTEQLLTAYQDCPVLQQVMTYLRNGWPRTAKGLDPALLPFYRVQTELAELDEVLIRGTHRVVIPPTLQPQLIQLAHDTHQGMVRTKQRLRELYWWPGMDSDVEAAIKSCTTCAQHDKTAITRAAPLQPVPLPDAAWEKLAMDIVGPFHSAPPDSRFAITLIDYYSKWPEVAFTSNVTSATVITFLSTVFSREGNPLELVTDNGPSFVSAEFEAFLAARDITHRRSSVYYPQSNGEVERWNRVLKDCLQTADIEGQPWKPFVTNFLLTYRATPHALTKVSPAELLHGRPFRTKLNIRNVASPRASAQPEDVSDTVALKQAKVKCYVDGRRGARSPQFQCGSYVRIRKPGIIKKGHSKFTQPLRVAAQKGPATYELSDGTVWNAIHLSPARFPFPEVHTTSTCVRPEDVYVPPQTPPSVQLPPRPQRSRRHIQPPARLGDFVT